MVHVDCIKKTGALAQQGFSLAEVLVALFLVAVGLLGTLGMLGASLAGSYEAYYRSQASFYAEDLSDRVRAWRQSAADYQYTRSENALVCSLPPLQIDSAVEDRDAWLALLACNLPNAQANVAITAAGRLQVDIFWIPEGGLRREASVTFVTQL